MDFRIPTGASYLGEPMSLPGQNGSFMTSAMPKTPQGTRAPSPVSGSGSGSVASETVRSQPPSQGSSPGGSRGGSRAPSRRASQDKLVASPVTSPVHIPGHASTPSSGSSSAFSPLFPFSTSAAPSQPVTRTRDRAKSVYLPPSSSLSLSLSADPFQAVESAARKQGGYDLGVSPLSLGLSPLSLGIPSQRIVSESGASHHSNSLTRRQQGRGLLASSNRTSVVPPGAAAVSNESTDEYAQIILASRSAKMRKWKTSNPAIGFDSIYGQARGEVGSRKGIPAFGDDEGESGEEVDVRRQDGIEELGLAAGADKEIEWVDWLDEYRKMKEAKLQAEQAALREEMAEQDEPKSPDEKGKGKETGELRWLVADVGAP